MFIACLAYFHTWVMMSWCYFEEMYLLECRLMRKTASCHIILSASNNLFLMITYFIASPENSNRSFSPHPFYYFTMSNIRIDKRILCFASYIPSLFWQFVIRQILDFKIYLYTLCIANNSMGGALVFKRVIK